MSPGAGAAAIAPDGSQALVIAERCLQEVGDYRAALQHWFRALAPGGQLVVTVPHAFLDDRQLELPSRRGPGRRRLYTPASLLAEVEEALVPNSYRVRRLEDRDAGYDYASPEAGEADILLVVQRIETPAWSLTAEPAPLPGPAYAFEAPVTRVETARHAAATRLLVLKLDHLGDFIMGMPALERLRATFPDAEITLVVGSWNVSLARQMGVADHVLAFDAFPRNSSEEEVDVPGKRALFEALVTGDYDLAIDLRTDHDTRFLLRSVRTPLRAGIGGGGEFPFLDIFLPTGTHQAFETARADVIGPGRFAAQPGVRRSEYRLAATAAGVTGGAVVWGPYIRLRPGRYIFEPFVEVDAGSGGLLLLDVALDARRVADMLVPPVAGGDVPHLAFTVERAAEVEFRVWTVADVAVPDFSFFGGRLLQEGARSALHQSEYLLLLVELIGLRVRRFGLFGGDGG